MNRDVYKRNNLKVEGNLSARCCLVFGHGFGTDQTAWQAVKAAFAQDYKLVLYDNTGAGAAEAAYYDPQKYNTLQGYAGDLVEICRELELEGAVYIGHSASGMIGLLASVQAPRIFSKMVLIGASPRYLNDTDYIGGFSDADLDGLFEAMQIDYLSWASGFSRVAMQNEERPGLSTSFAQSLQSLRPDIALDVARTIFRSDFRSVLETVSLPVLLIQAQKDIAVPEEVAHYLNRHIKGSKLVLVDAEGHFPHISAPSEIIKAVTIFLNSGVDED
ncbi:alpha/beta fold hydrolase [Pedobacter sp. SYSU D00535]|uniref:alpha/beta fold hydrolase n=1 Tax=Pedobacter sp. SYSU D00535 TaxID=2810308 RepID=UPI001A972E6C|nr:alpha/beta hydrolase [Pedobacter sp. SYSU D00535]